MIIQHALLVVPALQARTIRSALAVTALLLALAVMAPQQARAAIVVNDSIAGVGLGMSRSEVRGVLGTAASVSTGTNAFGFYRVWHYRRLHVTFQGGSIATSIRTTRLSQRTASGVGMGSTEPQVHAGLTGESCQSFAGVRHCRVGTLDPGGVVTDFALVGGVVVRIDMGYVID